MIGGEREGGGICYSGKSCRGDGNLGDWCFVLCVLMWWGEKARGGEYEKNIARDYYGGGEDCFCLNLGRKGGLKILWVHLAW